MAIDLCSFQCWLTVLLKVIHHVTKYTAIKKVTCYGTAFSTEKRNALKCLGFTKMTCACSWNIDPTFILLPFLGPTISSLIAGMTDTIQHLKLFFCLQSDSEMGRETYSIRQSCFNENSTALWLPKLDLRQNLQKIQSRQREWEEETQQHRHSVCHRNIRETHKDL